MRGLVDRFLARLRSLFRTLFRKEAVGADLDDELESYVGLLADEKVAAGMTRRDAVRAARLELGGVEQVKARVRERRIGASLESWLQDVRFAFRQFARNPGFAVVAIVTLALGIGANTAVFSVVSRVLLRPLPFEDESRVVTVRNTHVDGPLALSENEFLEYRTLEVFEAVGVYTFGSFALSGGGVAERLPGVSAASAVLRALRPAFVAGRPFTAEEDVPGAAPVALLSESIWERRFGRDPDIVGRSLVLNGVPRTVVGILPGGFRLPGGFTGPAPDVITPLQLDRSNPDPRNLHYLSAVARLDPGATVQRARTALRGAAQRISERLGTLPETFSATAVPVREDIVGSARPALLVLLGAVGLVLLVACVNIANLLLARADTRKREVAVRVSIGAGRRRVMRQLLTEAGTLALVGGAAGLGIGLAGARMLVALRPPGVPRLAGASIDPWVFLFCFAATLLTAVLIGLLPARRLAREDPAGVLGAAPRGTADRAGIRMRRGLVGAQVALAAMLSVGAVLLVRSLAELHAVDPGFEPSGVLTFQVDLPLADYPDQEAARGFYRRLHDELGAVPGVEVVGGTTSLPLASPIGDWGVRIRGRGPDGLGERGPDPDWMVVTPGYFEAMGIPLVRGRPFQALDAESGTQAVVINEEFARRHWPDGDALGAQLRMSTNIDTLWRTVVGIVSDVRQTSLEVPPRHAMYLPHGQFPTTDDDVVIGRLDLAIRTGLPDPARLSSAVREVVAELDPNVPVANLRPLRGIVSDATADRRFQSFLIGSFAALALILVIVGVYGVTAYLVARRTREIGIRIALGASPRGVRSLVLREGAAMTALGLAVGLAGAWILSRFMAGILYGVSARDPFSFLVVPVLLAVTVLLATSIPATRAARVDPREALRHD